MEVPTLTSQYYDNGGTDHQDHQDQKSKDCVNVWKALGGKEDDFNIQGKKLTSYSKIADRLNFLILREKYDKTTEYLSLCNTFVHVPPAVFVLLALKNLQILRNTCLETIPNEISKLKNLEYLDVRNNNLQSIPETLCELPNLIRIYTVGEKKLSALPWTDVDQMNKMSSVKAVCFGRNNFTKFPFKLLHMRQVTWIDLRYNPFTNLHEQIDKIFQLWVGSPERKLEIGFSLTKKITNEVFEELYPGFTRQKLNSWIWEKKSNGLTINIERSLTRGYGKKNPMD